MLSPDVLRYVAPTLYISIKISLGSIFDLTIELSALNDRRPAWLTQGHCWLNGKATEVSDWM